MTPDEDAQIWFGAYRAPDGYAGAVPYANLSHFPADVSLNFIFGSNAEVAVENLQDYLKRMRCAMHFHRTVNAVEPVMNAAGTSDRIEQTWVADRVVVPLPPTLRTAQRNDV